MSNFNKFPEGFFEVSSEEFYHAFFMYCLGEAEFRQPSPNRGEVLPYSGNVRMFEVSKDTFTDNPIGLVLINSTAKNGKHYPDFKRRIIYGKYGSKKQWDIFTNKFAAQFAGDNS